MTHTTMFKIRFGILAVLIALFWAATAFAQSGPVLLTITGAVENANRGGYNPDTDKLFGFNEVDFDKAVEFDFEALEALKMVEVNADFPKGGDVHSFEGPLLADLLAAAGSSGSKVMIQALDGYAVQVPFKELVEAGAVLALKRDGEFFGTGDFGPAQIVFPRADRADLADMPDDNWVWNIYHIAVE